MIEGSPRISSVRRGGPLWRAQGIPSGAPLGEQPGGESPPFAQLLDLDRRRVDRLLQRLELPPDLVEACVNWRTKQSAVRGA